MIDERYTAAIRQKDAIQHLLNSPGWELLAKMLSEQLQTRLNMLLEPVPSWDDLLRVEYLKGAAQAFRFVEAWPQQTLEGAQETIDALAAKITEDAASEGETTEVKGDSDG